MAVAFVTASTGTFAGGSGAIAAPASIATGNLLIAFIQGNSSSTVVVPGGWTSQGSFYDTTNLFGLYCYTKTATGSEPGTYTMGAGTGTGGVSICQYSGTTTLDTTALVNNSPFNNTSGLAPSQTPTVTGDMLLASFYGAGGQTWTTPSGMTKEAGSTNPPHVFDQLLPSTSPTGTISSTGSFSNKWISMSLLLKPTATVITSTACSITVGPLQVAASTVQDPCLRKAWLTLGALSVPLQDETAGYFCTNLDLGYPGIREVVNNNPDRDGVADRTQYLSSRVVSADITALHGAGARIDAIAGLFAPFMLPSNRPTLHYVLDRDGLPERTLTVRAANFSSPIVGPYQRDLHLQWVAADPVARDPNLKTATASNVTSAHISTPGDVPIRPLFRITGPITGPAVVIDPGATPDIWYLAFVGSFVVAAGHYIEIDSDQRTVLLDGDPAKPRLSSIDWTVSSWQWIPPAPFVTNMTLTGSATTSVTRLDAFWQDGYLT